MVGVDGVAAAVGAAEPPDEPPDEPHAVSAATASNPMTAGFHRS